jgi:hypothetical protein
LFGLELKKNKVEIVHIDNPVVHEGLEQNSIFIEKQIKAVHNLAYLISQGYALKTVTLYAFYVRLKKYRLVEVFIFFGKPFRLLISKILEKGYTNSLFLFDIYRLLEFSLAVKKENPRR